MTTDLMRNCRVCSNPKVCLHYVSKRVGVTVYRCKSCRSTYVAEEFTDTQLQSVYNHSVDFYDLELHFNYPGHERRLKELSQILAGRSGKKLRLLDIGCGTGKFLSLAKNMGYEVFGSEFSELPARLAKERHGIEISRQHLAKDPKDGFYDVITMWGLVEHVSDPQELMADVSRLLAPQGVIGIVTPVRGAYDYLAHLAYRFSGGSLTNLLDHRNGKAHLSILSEKALLGLLRKQKLQIISSRRVTDLAQPIENYLRNIGLRSSLLIRPLAWGIRAGTSRSWFFRNNLLVYAQKT